ncbi:MAG: helix-turn-helix domain-containing protein [Oscillospiraceae bacterium]|nr:MAG: helix-turn-helix domain-containing protein [Oscillospiraceae bacterium]
MNFRHINHWFLLKIVIQRYSGCKKGGAPHGTGEIGKFIASCRKEQGFTQAVLAEKLGITDRAVSKWETGRSLPDAATMPELCDLLKINLSELFSGERIAMENYKKTSDALLWR